MESYSMGDLSRDNFAKVLGLKRGVVKDLKDPDKLNRITVTLVDEGVETPFADVMTWSASKEYGSVVIPNVGDEVLVGFIDGDFNLPVILGCVYNSKNKPLAPPVDDKNEIMKIKFPAGLMIEVNNKKDNQKITITMKNKHVITLDDGKNPFLEVKEEKGETSLKIDFKNGMVDLKAKKKISMSAGKDTMVLEDGKGLALTSSGGALTASVKDVKLDAKNAINCGGNNIECNAKAKITMKGNAGAELSASGNTVVKGAMVQIN